MRNILSISLFCLLVISVFLPVVHVARSESTFETIYINNDGTITPSSAPIQHFGDLYVLTADVRSQGDGIRINRSGIILDGASHLLEGSGNGTGISLATSNTLDPDVYPNNVTIMNLTITHFELGLYIYFSSNDQIAGNIIVENNRGVYLDFGPGHTNDVFYGNSFIRNVIAFYSYKNVGNTFFHNNFINNTVQVSCEGTDASNDIWFNAYPVGGNYWSNYNGTDAKSGPYQNETGPDGFGDTPYQDNTPTGLEWNYGPLSLGDNYPLMNPYNYAQSQDLAPEFPVMMILPLLVLLSIIATVVLKKRKLDQLQRYF